MSDCSLEDAVAGRVARLVARHMNTRDYVRAMESPALGFVDLREKYERWVEDSVRDIIREEMECLRH